MSASIVAAAASPDANSPSVRAASNKPSSKKKPVTTRSDRKRPSKDSSSWVWAYLKLMKPGLGPEMVMFKEWPIENPTSFSKNTGTSALSRHLNVVQGILKHNKTGNVKQTVINQRGQLANPFELNDDKKAAVLLSLVEFILDNRQAFRLVESGSFAAFCKSLNMHYSLPSRATLIRAIQDDDVEARKGFVKSLDTIHCKIALTLDGWTPRASRGYFVVTLHWIDVEWPLKHTVLEVKYFPAPHNQ